MLDPKMARRPDMTTAAQTPEIDSDAGGEANIAAGNSTKIYRKKELVDAAVAASGIKKKTVKPVVDAVLAELGIALSRGDALNMPPLGKLVVNRTKDGPNAEVLIVKLRRLKPGAGGPEGGASADPDDDDSDDDDEDAVAALAQ